jgi:hypothetical protein
VPIRFCAGPFRDGMNLSKLACRGVSAVKGAWFALTDGRLRTSRSIPDPALTGTARPPSPQTCRRWRTSAVTRAGCASPLACCTRQVGQPIGGLLARGGLSPDKRHRHPDVAGRCGWSLLFDQIRVTKPGPGPRCGSPYREGALPLEACAIDGDIHGRPACFAAQLLASP